MAAVEPDRALSVITSAMAWSTFHITSLLAVGALAFQVPVAHAQESAPPSHPDSAPVSTPAEVKSQVQPDVSAGVTSGAVPTIHELLQTYRTMPFAEQCEVIVRREKQGQIPSERKAAATVRCDPREKSQRLRLDLGDLSVLIDPAQAVVLSAKDERSFVALARKESIAATLADAIPPVPLVNLMLALDPGMPDRPGPIGTVTWTATLQPQHVTYAAQSSQARIEVLASGSPLRMTESRVRYGQGDDVTTVQIRYTPLIYSEKDLAIDMASRQAKPTLSELHWGGSDNALAPRNRIANIHGNTADFKPWSLADAVASRKSQSDGPHVVAVLMFTGPLGIDAKTIAPQISSALDGVRGAATELRRAGMENQPTPRLGIEPLAVYDLATFERDAPAKLGASWASAFAGQTDGAALRWCLSPANTLDKFAKGSHLCIVLVDDEMNHLGTILPEQDAATVQAKIVKAIRGQ